MIAKLSFLRYVCLYIMFKIQVPQQEVLKRDIKQVIAAFLRSCFAGEQGFHGLFLQYFLCKIYFALFK